MFVTASWLLNLMILSEFPSPKCINLSMKNPLSRKFVWEFCDSVGVLAIGVGLHWSLG